MNVISDAAQNLWRRWFPNDDLIIKASADGEVDKVRALLSRVDPAAGNNAAIRSASMFGHADIVKILIKDPRVDPSAFDNDAIKMASHFGYTDIVQILLEDPRVDPAAEDNEAIQSASTSGHTGIVKILLKDPRVDPAANDNYAVRLADSRGHIDVVRILLVDPRVAGRLALRNDDRVFSDAIVAQNARSWYPLTMAPSFEVAISNLRDGEHRTRILDWLQRISEFAGSMRHDALAAAGG